MKIKMAKQGRKTSRSQGIKKQWHSSFRRNSGFSVQNLKQQTLSWKPVNEKTYALLDFILKEAEMKLVSENTGFHSENETEAVRTLTHLKKQCLKKLKSAYSPEAKWQNTSMQNCVECLEEMKAKNELLLKAQEEEERELEELEDELQSTES